MYASTTPDLRVPWVQCPFHSCYQALPCLFAQSPLCCSLGLGMSVLLFCFPSKEEILPELSQLCAPTPGQSSLSAMAGDAGGLLKDVHMERKQG